MFCFFRASESWELAKDRLSAPNVVNEVGGGRAIVGSLKIFLLSLVGLELLMIVDVVELFAGLFASLVDWSLV